MTLGHVHCNSKHFFASVASSDRTIRRRFCTFRLLYYRVGGASRAKVAFPFIYAKGSKTGHIQGSAAMVSEELHDSIHGPRGGRRRRSRSSGASAAAALTDLSPESHEFGESSDQHEDLAMALLSDEHRSVSSRRHTRVPGGEEREPNWCNPHLRYIFRHLRRLGDYLAYLTLLTMLIIIPIVMYRAVRKQKFDIAAFHSAEIMTLGTVILSARLVYLHLTHWYMPLVQRYVVRILFMVPIYSVQSYLSLRFHESRTYIDCFRDLYEAFVIANFVYYLIQLMGGEEALVQVLLQKSDTELGKHPWPLDQVLFPWELGTEFMLQCKHGVLQYVVFKTISTVLTFAFESMGIYHEGKFDWRAAYPYMCFLQNVSVAYAIYCLVRLYHAIKEELEYPVNWHPLGKFLCIKGVIFFTWWQGVIIFYLRAHGIIEDMGNWSSSEIAYGLIDYCIVIEMVGFAIAHSYTFTYKEYLPDNIPHENAEEVQNRREQSADSQVNSSSTWNQLGYRPPATLTSPMDFKDAFWSSAVPGDMREDIQRLRHEAMTVVRARNPVPASMSELIPRFGANNDSIPESIDPVDEPAPVFDSIEENTETESTIV